jgi:uncharacterized protein YraI
MKNGHKAWAPWQIGSRNVKSILLKIAAVGALMLAPAIAQAAEGYSTANVNMRAGPSTQYPAVAVIPAGESLEIHGCLADVPWCDVEFYGGRGWVAGRYVQALYQRRRVYVGPEYYRPLGIPTIVFSVGNYWDRYYRNRDFYHQRDRWRRNPVFDRGPDRRPDFDRGPDRRSDFDRDQNRRPDFDRQPDRRRDSDRRDFDRRPDRQPDFNAQPDRVPNASRQPDRVPDAGRQPDRRQDFNGRPDDNRRRDFNRDQNRRDFQRQQNDGDRDIRRGDGNRDQGGRNNDRRRPPVVCQPGDPTCSN